MESTQPRALRDWHVCLFLVVAALAVRLLFWDEYRFEGIGRDTAGYMSVARNFVRGDGWMNPSLRFLFMLPASLPFPDSYWSPLFPLMLAAGFKVFGVKLAAAKLVSLVAGVCVAPVLFALTRNVLGSWRAGLAVGALAAFHPTLVMWSVRAQPEMLMILLATLTFFVQSSPRLGNKPAFTGAVLGLAYLAKYQNVFLWPALVVYYVLNAPRGVALRRAAVMTAVFVAVISPWLVRNVITFGSPTYSAVSNMLLSYYPPFGGESRVAASLDAPPAALPYLLSHPLDVLRQAKGSARMIVPAFFASQRGSLWMFPLAALGLIALARRWRRAVPMLIFVATVVAVFCMTVPIVRYLFVIVPFWVCLAGAGAGVLLERQHWAPLLVGVALVISSALGGVREVVQTVADKNALWTPSANFGTLEALSVADFIRDHTAPDEVVMCAETYHYAFILERSAVQFPYDIDTMRYIRDRYAVRYLVTSLRDLRAHFSDWETSLPEWVTLVEVVGPERIARPAKNPHYPNVSETRVYRIDGDG